MRKVRSVDAAWGSYTSQQADAYYDKLEIDCVSKEDYRRWFFSAERSNYPCRTLPSFCQDCTLFYSLQMRAQGRCAKARNQDLNKQ